MKTQISINNYIAKNLELNDGRILYQCGLNINLLDLRSGEVSIFNDTSILNDIVYDYMKVDDNTFLTCD